VVPRGDRSVWAECREWIRAVWQLPGEQLGLPGWFNDAVRGKPRGKPPCNPHSESPRARSNASSVTEAAPNTGLPLRLLRAVPAPSLRGSDKRHGVRASRFFHHTTLEHSPSGWQIHGCSSCLAHTRTREVRPCEVRPCDLRPLKVRPREIRSLEIRTVKVRPYKDRRREIRSLEIRTLKVLIN